MAQIHRLSPEMVPQTPQNGISETLEMGLYIYLRARAWAGLLRISCYQMSKSVCRHLVQMVENGFWALLENTEADQTANRRLI